MGKIRRSKRSDAAAWGVGLLTFACGAGACGGGAPPVTAVDVPVAPRHPDGVVLEPSPAVPAAAERAPARGVVALREPLADEAANDVVRALVRGFEHEDLEAVTQLLTPDATLLEGGRSGRSALVDQWRTRMKNLDYGKLAGSEVARLDRMERFAYDDLGGPGAPGRPPEMQPGDLLVRVPIAAARVGTEQLFGDTLVLLLRRDPRDEPRYRIAGVAEENGP